MKSFGQAVSPGDHQTVVDLLRTRASAQPDDPAYAFHGDGGPPQTLTYAELDGRARAIAAQLSDQGARGERVLLLYPPGLDYVAAFYGCLYAGAVAVPAYPPDPSRLERSLPRLIAQARDAQPRVLLTTDDIAQLVPVMLASVPELGTVRCLGTDELPDAPGYVVEPGTTGDSLAMLQYTSGSTSTPRGVMLSHANLLANSAQIKQAFGTDEQSRAVIWLPPYHDMGLIGGILQPLFAGFPVTLMSPASFLKDPMAWLRALSEAGAGIGGGPNFAYDLCVRKSTAQERAALDLSNWKLAFDGAEPIRPATLRAFAEAFAPAGFRAEAFQPCYGLAEATLIVTGGVSWTESQSRAFDAVELSKGVAVPADGGRELISSGRPGPGRRVLLVDPESRTVVPDGQVGEIWIAGPDVAQGYWQRPEETEETFGARLADGEGPFLRSGDLGFSYAGELFVTGRRKDVIIIRGRNHYPQDLELTAERGSTVLRPGCGAAFTVDGAETGTERLAIAFEVAKDATAGSLDVAGVAAAVREAVAREHEITPDLVLLLPPGTLPKTSSGKVQRSLCAELVRTGEIAVLGRDELEAAPPVAPVQVDAEELRALAPAERIPAVKAYLVGLVTAAGATTARTDASLLALGLDSLALLGLQRDLETELGLVVGIGELIDAGTLADLAERLADRLTPEATTAPVSAGQASLWFLHELDPAGTAHTIAVALRMDGTLDLEAFRASVDALVERHPALRTTFPAADGEPVQRIAAVGTADVREHEREVSEEELAGLLDRAAKEPFDLAAGPLLRIHLFRTAGGRHVMLAVTHHIITDFWSMSTLVEELEALYAARTGADDSDLPAVGATYEDFVARQQRVLSGSGGRRLRSYWEEQLRNATPQLRLPRLPGRTADEAGSYQTRVGTALADRLRTRARAEGVTLSMVLLTAYQIVLHRYTGQDDLLVGMPVAGRGDPAFERLVGYCMNPAVIRSRIEHTDGVREALTATRRQVVGAIEHQDYPLHLLAETRGEHEPFQAMFVFNRPPRRGRAGLALLMTGQPGATGRFGELTVEAVPLPGRGATVDLELTVVDTDTELYAELHHRGRVLDADAAAALTRHWLTVLERLADDTDGPVGAVPLLDAAERELVLRQSSGPALDVDQSAGVGERFARQAAATPDAVAVESGGERLTYRELDERANRLAHQLIERLTGPEDRIGVYLDRSPHLIVAVLGAVKAGVTYVPVDSTHPRGRVEDVFADAGVRLVVSERKLVDKLPSGADALLLDELPGDGPAAAAQATAAEVPFVIYTSGSTGRPKGVQIGREGLTNYLVHAIDHFGLSAADRVLQFASPAFDASAEEIYATLLSGGTLVLRNDWMLSSPAAFLEQAAEWGITVLDLPTAYWHDLVAGIGAGEAQLPPSVRLVIIGGETVRADRLETWQRTAGRAVRLINTYGPSETTIVATVQDMAEAEPGGEILVGRPVANARAYVLDADGQPLPTGAAGEVYIGGAGVSRGYLNRDDLTRERFLDDPFAAPGARMYRTGDLARRTADGTLAFLGRADRQLKINGYRVEPGEIEAVLGALSEVRDGVVVLHPRTGRLTAYVVAATGHEVDPMRLRARLGEKLPGYLVPSAFIGVGEIPRTVNGKIDLQALPEPGDDLAEGGSGPVVAPRNAVEQVVVGVFADILVRSDIGVHDDFFHQGGHSLLATKVIARLRDHFDVDIPLRAVFESPTPAALAAVVTTALGPDGAPPLPPVTAVPRTGPLPLTFVQERIWLIQRLTPDTTVYNVPRALRIRGHFDQSILEEVFADLEERHELLRTVYPEVDGTPMQLVHEPRGIPIRHTDLGDLPVEEREQRIRDMVLEFGRQPFDVVTGPLIRVNLVRISPDEHVIIVIEHHLIHDGWAQGVFLRDFLELYEARKLSRAPRLPELPVQYADYAVWQRENLRGAELQRLLDFWTGEVDGAPQILELPTDRPHPHVLTFEGRLETLVIDNELGAAMRTFSRAHGATLFMTMATAFAALMHAYSSAGDMLIGVGIANRQRAETENLLGMLINTLLLRVGVEPAVTFGELLDRVRERCLRMYANQDMPFEKLVEHLKVKRSLGRMPLNQVMFSFLDTPMPALEIDGLTFEVLPSHNRTAKFDLNIVVQPRAEQRTGDATAQLNNEINVLTEYNADVFDLDRIRAMHDDFRAILAAGIAEPDRPLADFLPARPASGPAQPISAPPAPAEVALPEFEDFGEEWETEYEPPRTPLEGRLVEIWEQYLPVDRVGINDDFFDAGGHSLLANQVISRVQQEFGVDLPLRRLFEAPTIAELGVLILEAQATSVGDDQLAGLLAELEG